MSYPSSTAAVRVDTPFLTPSPGATKITGTLGTEGSPSSTPTAASLNTMKTANETDLRIVEATLAKEESRQKDAVATLSMGVDELFLDKLVHEEGCACCRAISASLKYCAAGWAARKAHAVAVEELNDARERLEEMGRALDIVRRSLTKQSANQSEAPSPTAVSWTTSSQKRCRGDDDVIQRPAKVQVQGSNSPPSMEATPTVDQLNIQLTGKTAAAFIDAHKVHATNATLANLNWNNQLSFAVLQEKAKVVVGTQSEKNIRASSLADIEKDNELASQTAKRLLASLTGAEMGKEKVKE